MLYLKKALLHLIYLCINVEKGFESIYPKLFSCVNYKEINEIEELGDKRKFHIFILHTSVVLEF